MNKEQKKEFKTELFKLSFTWFRKQKPKHLPVSEEAKAINAFNAGVKETLRYLGKHYKITKKDD